MNKIKRKFGIFGFFFPIAIAIIASVILVICLKASGFDVFAWLVSPHAVIAYLIVCLLLLTWARLWFGGEAK